MPLTPTGHTSQRLACYSVEKGEVMMTREQAFREGFKLAGINWQHRPLGKVRMSVRDRSKRAVTPYRLNVLRSA